MVKEKIIKTTQINNIVIKEKEGKGYRLQCKYNGLSADYSAKSKILYNLADKKQQTDRFVCKKTVVEESQTWVLYQIEIRYTIAELPDNSNTILLFDSYSEAEKYCKGNTDFIKKRVAKIDNKYLADDENASKEFYDRVITNDIKFLFDYDDMQYTNAKENAKDNNMGRDEITLYAYKRCCSGYSQLLHDILAHIKEKGVVGTDAQILEQMAGKPIPPKFLIKAFKKPSLVKHLVSVGIFEKKNEYFIIQKLIKLNKPWISKENYYKAVEIEEILLKKRKKAVDELEIVDGRDDVDIESILPIVDNLTNTLTNNTQSNKVKVDNITDEELKNLVIEKFFEGMNEAQKQAIFNIKGANLILAGAGSGKTATVCKRLMNLLVFGDAYKGGKNYNFTETDREYLKKYVQGEAKADVQKFQKILGYNVVDPHNILIVTFTCKAANELKERVSKLGIDIQGMQVGTFHSICNKILRAHVSLVSAHNSKFIILDNPKPIIKIAKERLSNISDALEESDILSIISKLKNKQLYYNTFSKEDLPIKYRQYYGDIKALFKEYQDVLLQRNSMDYDDLLYFTVRLFEKVPDVLKKYRNLWQYIMVDEYQDTNGIQYQFIKYLTGDNSNVMVVGDENQSIYGFRDADIRHILNFESEYNANKFLLEQNYRSTEIILNAANQLIANNTEQMGKNLWTANKGGKEIKVKLFSSALDEVDYIIKKIQEIYASGVPYKEIAVLARTKAVLATFKSALKYAKIPYEMTGDFDFMKREEIVDIITAMSIVGKDDMFTEYSRLIKYIPRLGKMGYADIVSTCKANNIGLVTYLEDIISNNNYTNLTRTSAVKFLELAKYLRDCGEESASSRVILEIAEKLDVEGYFNKKEDASTVAARLENIDILSKYFEDYISKADNVGTTSEAFADYITELRIECNVKKEEKDTVKFYTVHASKGLEFDTVFIAGMSEGILPMLMSDSNPEEERRIGYVAVTRAKRQLYLTHASERMVWGECKIYRLSSYVKEMKLDTKTKV